MVVCMEKYAWRGKIVPGMQEEYKKRHDNIWPEMKEVLANAGIVNYSRAIFYCQIQHRALKIERPSAWDTRR